MDPARQTIEIVVGPDGKASLETKGFEGAGCRQASAPYERALGSVAADTPTAEARALPPLEAKSAVKPQVKLG